MQVNAVPAHPQKSWECAGFQLEIPWNGITSASYLLLCSVFKEVSFRAMGMAPSYLAIMHFLKESCNDEDV